MNNVRLTTTLLCMAIATGLASGVRADAPALIPVQGFLSDAKGAPVEGTHRVTFSIFDAKTSGKVQHTDDFQKLDVTNGAFVAYLGTQTDLDLGLFQSQGELWLEVVIDGTEIITPRTQLGSVPYAAYAQSCGDTMTVGGKVVPEDIFSGNYVTKDTGTVGDLSITGALSAQTTTVSDLNVTGTLTPGALSVQEFHADPRTAWTLSSTNTLADVPELLYTFTVAQTTPVMVSAMLSADGIDTAFLVTRLLIDDVSVGNTLSGNTQYWGNTMTYVGTVAKGTHTVKVMYRTPDTGANWAAKDWTSRRLDVLVMGR